MSTEQELLRGLEPRLQEAVDSALLGGLLKYTADGRLAHAPFSLAPSPISPALHAQLEALTAPFGRLALAVANAPDFLRDTLAPAARVDPFTARLLELTRQGEGVRHLRLLVTRSDYFLHQPQPGQAPLPRQVELNLIAASYPGLAGRVAWLHGQLLYGTPWAARMAANDPIPRIADAFAEAHRRYGHPQAMVLMLVQPGETNVFDQRLLEFALRERGLETRRATLEEVAREGRLREGHLELAGRVCAIAYFRAAYGPEDFPSEDAFRARALIENASVISVPDLAAQLAGTKKVQQVLCDPGVLGRFLQPDDARAVQASFAGQYALDQPVAGAGSRTAREEALARPEDFVLKPQREGGGHNAFDAELVRRLRALPAAEQAAYILMERIRPVRHAALLVREGTAQRADAVSEIGRFGVLLAEGATVLRNEDVGYLVRSKAHDTLEGGVSAGYGFLDSLLLDEGVGG